MFVQGIDCQKTCQPLFCLVPLRGKHLSTSFAPVAWIHRSVVSRIGLAFRRCVSDAPFRHQSADAYKSFYSSMIAIGYVPLRNYLTSDHAGHATLLLTFFDWGSIVTQFIFLFRRRRLDWNIISSSHASGQFPCVVPCLFSSRRGGDGMHMCV